MKLTTIICTALMFLSALVGCTGSGAPTAPPSPTATGPATPARQPLAIESDLAQIAAAAKGRVGVSAILLETGETVASLKPADHFPMQSVYKLPISMAVVKQVDAGKLKLDQKIKISKEEYIGRNAHSPIRDQFPDGTEMTVTELMRFALSES